MYLLNFYFLFTGAIVDAVTIYSKYISLNAESPIFLPTPKRQEIEGREYTSLPIKPNKRPGS